MTQAEFIQAVQVEFGDKAPAKAIIKAVLVAAGAVSRELLQDGRDVEVVGLGKIKVVQRAARAGRNPRTGAAVEIPARKAAKYTPSKAVKDAINK